MIEVGRDELVAVVPPDHAGRRCRSSRRATSSGAALLVYDRASQITDLTLGFLLDRACSRGSRSRSISSKR